MPEESQAPDKYTLWNPLPAFDTVKQDNQLANIQTIDKFFAAAKDGTLPTVAWITPENTVSEHPPASIHAKRAPAIEVGSNGYPLAI